MIKGCGIFSFARECLRAEKIVVYKYIRIHFGGKLLKVKTVL